MPPRILIVDDEQSMCELVETDLRLRDFESAWRTSPDEALQLLQDMLRQARETAVSECPHCGESLHAEKPD